MQSRRQRVQAASFPRVRTRLRPAGASGFSLVEVMVVVVILGILGAIAYPSYIDYVVRSNRAAAQSFMLEVANVLERYQLDNRAYATGAGAMAALGFTSVPSSVSNHYAVTIDAVAGPPAGYAIRAVPSGEQATRDAGCGTLSLTNTGAKQVSGARTDCWQ
ncbi:prepilin-type N-terminal cleavage/methylation domain-containing protein [Imbroritus primus]|uniref:Prepilin-type N-terminal cleavage/methylation domain-containing protein n=1 Tax=Imbroritus primus TaxID=3058603 RepID=A0ACD3SNK3_9BURK|nr:prepilin-type N-terminal cleavage/methylation domain-containing protein [Burkholderiaceae bacterium PBA]